MTKTVTLEEAQARLVMQALDVAVRNGGLNTAVQLLPVAQSIEHQLTAQTVDAPEGA